MAIIRRLRIDPADGRFASALLAAVLATTFLAVQRQGKDPPAPPTFLTQALGDPQADAPLTRRPAPGVGVVISDDGYSVSSAEGHISLTRADAGAWERFQRGASRPTEFGSETITVNKSEVELYLTVEKRQGPKTWSWQLGTDGRVPRLGADGAVAFLDGKRLSDLSIDPVAIYDARSKEITPPGARWSLRRDGARTWLELRLDDRALPLPYVIDPAVDYPSPLYLSSTPSAVAGSWKLGQSLPLLGDSTTRNSLCKNCAGYIQWKPGLDNGVSVAPSSIPTGTGWIVDAAGATGFPAGNWSFTVETDIPDLLVTPGKAILTVGVWKGTVSGGAFTPTQTLLAPTDDPAAQDLRTSVLPVVTTATYSLPRFSLAAGETLYVEYWRNQVVGINDTGLARRSLDFVVNDGVAKITHPPADDVPPLHALSIVEGTRPDLQHFASGTGTYYYNPAATGTFTIADTLSDSGSGPDSVAFPTLSSAGFSGTGTTDTTSPFVSSTYTFNTSNVTASVSQTITGDDKAGNSAATTLNFIRDVTAPSGGSVSYLDGTDADGVVVVTTTDGSDTGSGVNTASAVLERATATYSSDVCGVYGAWSPVTSPDTVPAGSCAMYRYRVSDNVANEAIYTSAHVVRVPVADVTPPTTPALTLAEAPATPYQHVAGTTLYYNASGTNSGTFTVDAATADAESGISRVDFPAVFGLDGGSDATSPYQASYSWTPTATASGAKTVTATSGAGGTATSSFTVTRDVSPPSVSLTGPTAGAIVRDGQSVSASATDALAGVAQVDFAYCAGASCSWLLATPIASDSTAPYSVTWSAPGADGQYTLLARATDNVGNVADSPALTVTVDNTPPSGALSLSEGARPDLQHFDAATSTLFYNPVAAGDFTLAETASDAAGILKVDFPAVAEQGFSGAALSDLLAPYESNVYGFDAANLAAPSPAPVLVADLAGNTRSDTLSFVRDTVAPSGGSISYSNEYDADGSVTVTAVTGTDSGAGVGSTVLERQTASLADGSCGAFGSWSAAASPNTLPSGTCARYRYTVVDNVGNGSVYASANVAKVDLSAPAVPALTLAESEPDEHIAGSTLYYNPSGANSGTFTVAAVTSDAQSAVAGVDFPAVFGSDSASAATSPYETAYSWTSSATAAGPQAVIARNGAGLTASAEFTLTADTEGPAASLTAPIALRNGDALTATAIDAQAGTAQVEFRYCPGATCTWAAGTAIGTDASAPYSVLWSGQPSDGTYTLLARAADNVGNVAEAAPATVTVDNTTPLATQNDPGTPLEGTVTVQATVSDVTAGVASVTFEVSPGGQSTWTTIATDTAAPYSTSWDTLTVNDGRYDLRVSATDRAGNTAVSAIVRNRQVTNHPPVVSITAPDAYYVTANDPDPYTITAASPSPNLRHVEFFRCSNSSVSCTTGSWISLGLDGTAPYSATWAVDPDGNRALKAVVTNLAWSEGTDVNNVLIDRTAPAGGSIAYADGYAPNGTVAIATDGGSDAGSGIDTSSGLTERQLAPLSGDACGTWGPWSSAPISPDTVPDASCARYRYHIFDEAGNEAIFNSGSVAKVDLTGPAAPSLAIAESEPDEYATGTVVFYNPSGSSSGSFTVSAASADPESGLAALDFPSVFGADGGSDPTSPYEGSYDWNSTATASGAHAVAARNAAGLSSSSSFTVTPDTTPPAGGSVTYADGYDADGVVPVVTGTGADALSGIDLSSAVLERRLSALDGDACAPFAGAWLAVTAPDSVASGLCAQYRYRVFDNVGNEAVYASARIVKVDLLPPETTIDSAPADPSRSASASFSFSASEAGSVFDCALDGVGFSSCLSPADYSSLSEGTHTFRVRARDFADNADPTPATITWTVETVDVTPPAITLGSKPASPSNEPTPSFAFTASEPVLGFECDLDGGGFGTCLSPVSYAALGEGEHTIRVRATDLAGNTGSAAYAWTIDVTAPAATVTDPGTPLDGTVTLQATASDALAGVSDVSFQVSPSGQEDWTTVQVDATSPFSVAWNTLSVTDGRYDLRALAVDRAGNQALSAVVRSRQVSNHPPSVHLTSPEGVYVNAGDPDPFPLAAASPESDLSQIEFFRCSDASVGCSTGTWISLGTDADAPYAAVWPVDADGNRALKAVATNSSGGQGIDLANVLVDRTSPGGGSIAYADGYDADGMVEIATTPGSDSGSGLDLSSGITERQTAPLRDGSCGLFADSTGAPFSPDAVPDASCARYRHHIFDEAGNEAVYTSASIAKVDLTPPPAPLVTLVESSPYAYASGQTLFVNTAQAGSYDVEAASADPESGILRIRFPGSVDVMTGPYRATFGFGDLSGAQTVTAVNGAGLAADATFTVAPDADAPSTSDDTVPIGSTWSRTPVTVELSAEDAASGVAATYYSTDGSVPTAASPDGTSIALSGDGVYALSYFSVDNVGNAELVRAAANEIRIDSTPPAGGSVSYPDGPDADGSVTVAVDPAADLLSGIDPGSGALERRTSALTDGMCAPFAGSWASVASPDTVAPGLCSQYRYRVSDLAGNEAVFASPNVVSVAFPDTTSTVIDTTAPGPVTLSGAIVRPFQLARSFQVSWSAADAATYDIRFRVAGTSSRFGAYVPWQSATAATAAAFTGSPGSTYCFSARAADAAGNLSSWSADSCTAVPLNDTKLTHRGSWTKAKGSGYYLGTYSRSPERGASLVRTGVEARRLAIVVTKCPTCGTLGVYWNGHLIKKVGLASSTLRKKQLVIAASFASIRSGTLVLKVLSSGLPVSVEGLGTARA